MGPILRRMSAEQVVEARPAIASASRLRRGAVVIMVAFGLLSMHGLTGGSTGAAPHHGLDAAMVVHTTTASDHADDMVASEHRGVRSADGGNNASHAIGEACLWLIVGGALLFFLRRVGTRVVQLTRGDDEDRLEPPRWSVLRRPPDLHLATVALRC